MAKSYDEMGGWDLEITRLLHEYPYIEDEVKKLNNKLIWIVDSKYSTKVTSSYSAMPRGNAVTDPVYKAVERVVIRYDREIIEIEEEISVLLKKRNQIDRGLSKLKHDEYKVIALRCFKRMRWREISKRMHYSKSHCHRILVSGIKKLEDDLADCQNQEGGSQGECN